MHYVLQENIFHESNYNLLIRALERLDLSYDVVRIFPFVNKVVRVSEIPLDFTVADDLPDYVAPAGKVFVFGAIKLARVATDFNWYPGSMMNENHDYSVYSKFYRDHLLNYDSEIVTLSTPLSWAKNEKKFIRPTQDTKSFSGKVYGEEEWVDIVSSGLVEENFLLNKDTVIQLSTVKNIQKEIRFWVIGGLVITGSQYKLRDQALLSASYDEEATAFAQQMVDIYQPAEAFVIDVCMCEGEWKIVECNCINAAGFYLCDIQKMITALECFF